VGTKQKRSRRLPATHTEATRWRRSLFWVFPAILAAVLFLPAVESGRVWDDTIVLETQISAFRTASDAFFPPDLVPQWPYYYYRPLLTASYMIERYLFGAEATQGFHAMVIAYHVANTFFVVLLAAMALRGSRYRWWGAMATGALFAAHPIHTESVCWITGRTDTLAALFLFPALLLAIVYRDHRSSWALWLSPLLFLCAALTKEAGLAALGVLPFWLALVPAPNAIASNEGTKRSQAAPWSSWRAAWPLWVLYGAATLVYLTLRVGAGTGSGTSELVSRQPLELLGRLSSALAYYLAKAVVPVSQSALVTTLPGMLATLVAVTAITGFTFFSLRRAKSGQGIWLLAIVWFGISLLPSLPIAVLRLAEAPVAERYLYLPSFGLCLIFGALLVEALSRSSWRNFAVGIAIAVIFVASLGTLRRAAVWRSDLALWSDTVAKEPNSGLAWSELGKAHLDRGRSLEKALEAYEKSVRTHNDSMGRAISFNSIGVIHARQGREEEALVAWLAATGEEPSYASPSYNLGNFLARRFESVARQEGRFDFQLLDEARSHLSRAVEHDPRYRKAWLRLIWCDVQKVMYLPVTQSNVNLARVALGDAEKNRLSLASVDPEGSFTQQAEQLLQRAREFLGRGAVEVEGQTR